MKTKVTLLICLVLALVCLTATSCDLMNPPAGTTAPTTTPAATAAATTETPVTQTPVTQTPVTSGSQNTPPVIDVSTIRFEDKTVSFTKNAQTLVATGVPDGVDVEYECAEGSAVWPGTYEFTAIFTVPEGVPAIPDMTATLTIEKADYVLNGVSFDNKTVPYNGSVQSLTITGTLPSALRPVYDDNTLTEVGETTATVSFVFVDENDAKGYNPPASLTAKLTVEKGDVDMSGITFEDTTLPFTGNPQTLTITGTLPAGVTVGAYSAPDGETSIVSGSVTITVTFVVTNQNYNVPAAMTATLTIGKGVYDMTGIYPTETSAVYTGSDLIAAADAIGSLPANVTLSGTTVTKDGAAHEGAILDVGVYVITRTFTTSDDNYDAPANVVTTLTVTPKDADLSGLVWEGRDGFVYDGTEKTVSLAGLPDYVVPTYGGTCSATDSGSYTATATLASNDPNYKIPDGFTVPDLTWQIAAQAVNMESFAFSGATTVTYDSAPQDPLTHNGDGITGIASATLTITKDGQAFEGDIIDAGVYLFTVTFTVEDGYANVSDRTATLTVEQATIDVSSVAWDYEGPFDVTTAGAKTVAVTGIPTGAEAVYGGTYTVEDGVHGDFVATVTFVATDAVNYKIVGSVADLKWTVSNWSDTKN